MRSQTDRHCNRPISLMEQSSTDPIHGMRLTTCKLSIMDQSSVIILGTKDTCRLETCSQSLRNPPRYSIETNPRKVSLPHENSSDSDGDIVPPPTIPNIPTLVRLEYCNLQSHAEFLVSEDGPPAMGVRKQSVKFAKNRLRKRPENFAGCNVLPKYGKWAADEAGETYKEICRRCFIKYQDYFHLRTKMHATCCCQVIKGKGNKGNRQKYRTESRDLSKATRMDMRRDTSKKA